MAYRGHQNKPEKRTDNPEIPAGGGPTSQDPDPAALHSVRVPLHRRPSFRRVTPHSRTQLQPNPRNSSSRMWRSKPKLGTMSIIALRPPRTSHGQRQQKRHDPKQALSRTGLPQGTAPSNRTMKRRSSAFENGRGVTEKGLLLASARIVSSPPSAGIRTVQLGPGR